MVEADVMITWKDLYDYNLKHAYTHPAGLLGSAFGAIGLIYGTMGIANGKGTQAVMILIVAVLLLVYMPLTLLVRAKQAALNPEFKKPLHYVVDETGLTVSQGDISTHLEWKGMYRAVSTTRSIILYTSKVNATIFPRNQLGDATPLLVQVISSKLPANKVKIRF